MSPLEINILLECYASGAPGANISERIWRSEATNDALRRFMQRGLITPVTLKTTPKGDELVAKLCAIES